MGNENKVLFNLKNVHYAIMSVSPEGVESWASPVPIKGAVSLAMNAEGDTSPFYADGIKYYVAQANAGYTGDLEIARIPDKMLAEIWGQAANTEKVIMENVKAEFKEFALLFQIDGDADEELYALYRCSASRPSLTTKTNTTQKEPQPQKLAFSAAPLESNGNIRARTTYETAAEKKKNWFKTVYAPTV